MGSPYVGEIRIFAGNFAPNGWMFCDGSLISIADNEVLFQLIGTTYGGDGQDTYALPDLRGRIPIHQGQGPGLGSYVLAQTGGVEQVTLSTTQIPVHTHPAAVTTSGQALSPQGAYFASVTSTQAGVRAYAPSPAAVALAPDSILPVGGNQPHENMQPTLFVNYIISMFGIFPSQN